VNFCILLGLVSLSMKPSRTLMAWTALSWMILSVSLSTLFPWASFSEVRYMPFISIDGSPASIAFSAFVRMVRRREATISASVLHSTPSFSIRV